MDPAATIEQVRKAHRRMLRSIDDLTDDQAEAPSRLPGWSRAEVITHLARNADGLRSIAEAAARGERGAMYPGGLEQRANDIAAGRDAPAAALRADLRRACDRLLETWAGLTPDAWSLVGMTPTTARPVHLTPWIRWREVDVHHVDAKLGYEASDWPVGFVTCALDEIFGSFPERSAPARPLVGVEYRVLSTDHERAWRVALHGKAVTVTRDDDVQSDVDGEARGWGCDVVAWLYGRDPRGGGIVASGDLGVLRLPQWFPYT